MKLSFRLVRHAILTACAPFFCAAAQPTWKAAAGTNAFGTATNWLNDTLPLSSDTVLFTGSSQSAIDVAVSTAVNGIAFDTSGGAFPAYTLGTANNSILSVGAAGVSLGTGGAATVAFNLGLTLTANQTWTVGSGETLNAAGVVSGAFALGKAGAGTLVLSAANTFSGGTAVSGGTLAVAADGQLGAVPASATPGAVSLDGGGLQATASFTLNANRGLALGAAGGTLTADPAVTLTYNGIVAGTGALTKAGGGTLVLGGANTYTGATTIANGYLSIASDAALGAAPATATAGRLVINGSLATTASFTLNANRGVTLASSGSSFDIANGTTLTYGGIMAGAGRLNMNPIGGTLVLTGNNTYTGTTTVFGGTLQVGSGGASGSLASSSIVNNGALIFNSGFTGSENESVYAGAISGSGTLEKKGTGFTYLSGDVASGGGITVSGGVLTIGAGGTTGTLSGNVTVANGAQLQFYRSDAVAFNGAISGAGNFATYGGTLTLGGANTYGGNTFVSSQVNTATLADAAAGSYSPNSTMRINSGATLQVNNNETIAGLNDYSANTSGSVVLASAKTLTVENGASSPNKFSGVISGGGGLLKKGAGTLTLQGANTFTGGTTISDGTLALGTSTAATPTVGSLASTGVLNLSPGAGTTATFNVANGGTQTVAGLNFSGAASTSAASVTLGTGTLVLGGDVAYDATNNPGAATISGGTVQLGAARTFTIGDSSTTTSELAIASPIVDAGAALGLTKAGGGTLLLTGANTYTGGTTIGAGKLALGTGGSLAAAGGLTLSPASAATATFELSGGQNQTVAGLTFGGAMTALSGVLLNAGTLTLNGNVAYDATNNPGGASIAASGGALSLNDATRTFDIGDSTNSAAELSIAAPITSPTASAGALTKTGAGTLLLSGANTYAGATTIRGGRLALGSGAALAGSVVVDAAGTSSVAVFDVGSAAASIGGLTFGGSSNESAASNTVTIGTGTLTLNGNVSYLAPSLGTKPLGSSIGGGTLSLPAGAHTFAVADIDTLTQELSISAFIAGAGGITKTGAGTLALNNSGNSFSGTLALQEGAVTVNSLSALGAAAGPLSFGNGVGAAATLRFTGSAPSATSKPIVLNGTGAYTLDASGAGVTASATFSGAVTPAGTGTRVLTLTGGNAGANTLAGAISGGVNLQKSGSGTWRLAAANTYTGTTVIENGTLRLGANDALPATSDVYLNLPSSTSQATLDFANTSQTVNSLTFAGAGMGAVTLGTGTLTLNGALAFVSGGTQPAPATISGGTIALPASRVVSVGATSYLAPQLTITSQLTGAGGLTKADAGALLLTGSNTFAGGTTISGGAVIAASDTALGTGAIAVGNGARLAASEFAHNSTVTLANPVTLASGAGFGSSYAEGRLRLSGAVTVTGTVSMTGTAATIYGSDDDPTVLTGTLDAATAGTAVTVGGGRLGLSGSVGGNIATLAADGGALFFGSTGAMPAGAGSIAVLNNGYAGVVGRDALTPDPNVLLSHVAPANYNGTLGFDTDHENASHATVFTAPLDLTGFTQANFRLGTMSLAVLAGAIKPAGGTNYPFGNGHGLLVVQSNLGGNAGVTVSSGVDRELVVALRGNNTFTGNIAVERSAVLLDGPRALPATARVTFGAGFNYFGATEAWGRADDFVAKFTAITQTKPIQVASLVATSNVAVLGLDSRASVEQTLTSFERDPSPRNLRTISEPINLAGLTDASVYLGTLSNVAVNGTVTGIPDTGGNALSLLALEHGQLAINSVLASTGVHHVKIGSAALGEEGGVVRLMNNNSYAGGTQLQGGTLLVGAAGALGTGPLTVDAGTSGGTPTLAAATSGNVTLANPITLTTGLHLGRTRDLDDSAGFVQARGATLTLAGSITGTGTLAGRNGRTFITGSNNYSGATYSDYGALIFGSALSLPTTTIYASRSGYLGAAFTAGDLATDFLAKIDPSATGTIGLDTLPGASASTFAAVDLHAFNSVARLGSATQAAVSGAITPSSANPNVYRFGGGGGTLTVTGALTDNGTAMRGVSVDSPPEFPLTLRLAGANTYTGGTNVANSAVIFAAGALPGGSLALNAGGYIGTEDTANVATFLGRFAPPTSAGGIVGLDTAPGAGTVSFAGALGLGGSLASAFVGTATSATFASTASIFATQTSGTVHRLAGYKGGSLRLEFPITAGSVIVGDADTPQTHGTDTTRSTVTLAANNSYAGGTTLVAGALAVGSASALGSGALTVNEANFARGSNPLLYSAISGLTIPNAIVLNAELDVGSGNHLTLGGVISGAEEIYKVGSGTLTLSGSNTFSGGVYLAEGSLNVSSATALGTGPLQLGLIASSVNFLVPATLNGLFGDNALQQIATPGGGQLTINQTFDSRFPGKFVGSGSVLLSNSGATVARMVLGGASTFTGGATIGSGVVAIAAGATSSTAGAVTAGPLGTGTVTLNGGKLAVDGGIVFSNPLTLTSGRLGGTGTFAPVATLTIAGSGANRVTLAPGEGTPGTLAFTNTNLGGTGIVLSLAGGGAYDWKLMDATNASGGWDMVAVTGTVDISATSANPFKFQLTSVLANGSGGLASNFTQTVGYQWQVLTATSITNFAANKFAFDTSLFSNANLNGNFGLSINPANTVLTLTFTPVPEPSTYLLLGGGLAALALALRRRRAKR